MLLLVLLPVLIESELQPSPSFLYIADSHRHRGISVSKEQRVICFLDLASDAMRNPLRPSCRVSMSTSFLILYSSAAYHH
ncbi:hypothetical protein B0H11DRAFT_326341 [Mycena galericulata]|nr:hypothetical protein B0H11DRAFT_326341 [Mycena galericulata]